MGINKEMRTEMGMRARKQFAEDIDLADRFEYLFDVSFRVVCRKECYACLIFGSLSFV